MARKANMALFSLLLLLVAVHSALPARIAGFHAAGGSRYMNLRHTMEELASRGHEVATDVILYRYYTVCIDTDYTLKMFSESLFMHGWSS